MAPRRGRASTLDPVREANALVAAVNPKIGRHVTMCYRCAHAGADTARFCDLGWALAKEQTIARNGLRRATEAASQRPVQGELW